MKKRNSAMVTVLILIILTAVNYAINNSNSRQIVSLDSLIKLASADEETPQQGCYHHFFSYIVMYSDECNERFYGEWNCITGGTEVRCYNIALQVDTNTCTQVSETSQWVLGVLGPCYVV